MTDRRDIPGIPDQVDPDLRRALVRMREELQALLGFRGNDPAMRVSGGGASGGGGITIIGGGGGGGGAPVVDLTPPPTPENFAAVAGLTTIILSWSGIGYTQGNRHKQTVIYGVQRLTSDPSLPTFGEAQIVAVAPNALTLYALSSEPNRRWHLWAKFETNDGVLSVNPAGGVNGFTVTTGQDPAVLLALLTGQITESQLFASLGARINLIDGPNTLVNSVSARVKAETDARIAAIEQEILDRLQGDVDAIGTSQAFTESYAYSILDTDAAIAASASAISTAFATADANTLTAANAYVVGYTYSISNANEAIAAAGDILRTEFQTADATGATNAQSYVQTYAFSKSEVNTALATLETELLAEIETASGGGVTLATVRAEIEDYTYAQATIDGAIAATDLQLRAEIEYAEAGAVTTAQNYTQGYAYALADGQAVAGQVNTLSATVSGQTTAISQEAEARIAADGALFAQWTVKLDVAGLISGFGLASTGGTAAPTSAFGIRAGQFWVAPPTIASSTAPTTNLYAGKSWLDTSVTPNVTRFYNPASGLWQTTMPAGGIPFTVVAEPTTINGVTVPPGLYANEAFIANGTIGNAKIGNAAIDDAKIANLSAAKLTAGDGTIGGNLRSANWSPGFAGWQLQPDGYFEASNAVLRGSIFAGAGQIGGIAIAASSLQSTNFSAGSAGFRIQSTGNAEFNSVTVRNAAYVGGGFTGSVAVNGGFTVGAGGSIRSANYVAGVSGYILAETTAQLPATSILGTLTLGQVPAGALNSNVIVGGRNLLVGSSNGVGWSATSFSNREVLVTAAATGETAYITSPYFTLPENTEISISFESFQDGPVSSPPDFWLLSDDDAVFVNRQYPVSASWIKNSFTLTTTAAFAGKPIRFRVDHNGSPGAALRTYAVRNLKLELGNKATDWTPPIEDTDAAIGSKLNRAAADTLAAPITLTTGGAIRAGDTTNGVVMAPSGLAGYKAGAVTFSINTTGDVLVRGRLANGSAERSGTTMTGSGVNFAPDGSGVFGNATTNLTFNGSVMTMNGRWVTEANLAFTEFSVSIPGGGINQNFSTTSSAYRVIGTSRTASPVNGAGSFTYVWSFALSLSNEGGNILMTGNSNGPTVGFSSLLPSPAAQAIGRATCTITDANGRSAAQSFAVQSSHIA